MQGARTTPGSPAAGVCAPVGSRCVARTLTADWLWQVVAFLPLLCQGGHRWGAPIVCAGLVRYRVTEIYMPTACRQAATDSGVLCVVPPPAAVRKGKEGKVPVTMALAREETETALNVCIQHVLDRTGLKPHQVGGR